MWLILNLGLKNKPKWHYSIKDSTYPGSGCKILKANDIVSFAHWAQTESSALECSAPTPKVRILCHSEKLLQYFMCACLSSGINMRICDI